MATVTSNIEQVIKGILKDFIKVKSRTLGRSSKKWKSEIQGIMKDLDLVASGELLRSVGFTEKDEETLELFVSAAHAKFVNEGIKPGNWTKLSRIKTWTQLKVSSDRNAPFKIQRAIFKKGIKARPFFDKANENLDDLIKKSFSKAFKEEFK